jgi:hypothetical protein
MDEKRWTIFSVVALIIAFAVLAGGFFFVKNAKENAVRLAPNAITSKIISAMNFADLAEVSKSQLSKHYDIPEGVISDSSLYMSKSSDSASELACFLLKDKSKFTQLQASIMDRINAKATGFKSLNPAQYNNLKNCLIIRNGKYVLVSVGNNNSAVEKLFNEMLQ